MTSERLEQSSPKSGARNDVSRDPDPLTIMVGIPCYNEEVAIGSLVVRASQYADKVVVLDDGSVDKTAEVARLLMPASLAQNAMRSAATPSAVPVGSPIVSQVAWESLSGQLAPTTGPAVSSQAAGKLDVFVIGTDNALSCASELML